MEILATTLRVCVDDLEAATGFYERLTGSPAQRYERAGVRVAAVGCFLLMSGPEEELAVLRKVSATLAVRDVDEAHASLVASGARVIAGPLPTPGGRNLIAVHPDGSVYEYADRRPAGRGRGAAGRAAAGGATDRA